MERVEDKIQGDQTPEATSEKTLKDIEETQELRDDRRTGSSPSPDGQLDEPGDPEKAGPM